MYPPGYPALTGKEGIPLDLFLTDSLSAHRSFACRAAGYPFIQGDRDQIGDVLPYRETRIRSSDKPKGGGETVDVMKIYEDVSEPLQVPSCKVTDLVDLVASGAGSLSQMNGEQQHAGNDGALHAVVVFIHEGSLTPECIQKLTRSFTLTPQFWDYYGTASVINSVSAMIVPEGETPTDDVTLHLCHPVGTVREKANKELKFPKEKNPRDKEMVFDFSTPSFHLKWKRESAPEERPGSGAGPEVLMFCLLSPKTNYEELKQAIIQAYRDSTTKAVLRQDPFSLFGVVLLQWLGWSQELFYQLEQLVLGIESNLDDDMTATSRTFARHVSDRAVNFSEMHRISKHIIQYLDSLQVTTALQDSLTRSHKNLHRVRQRRCLDGNNDHDINNNTSEFQRVDDALAYYKLAFIGVKSRVEGLKNRMDNQINLGYNITQQRDAQVSQGTNKSMHTLSIITLAFLPLTAVASVLAMPYFSVHESDITWIGSRYTLAWAVATGALLSLMVLLLWSLNVWFGSQQHRLPIWTTAKAAAEKDRDLV